MNEKYRVTMSENVALKEKVEILFKLSRSYFNCSKTHQNNTATNVNSIESSEANNDVTEVNDNVTDDVDDSLGDWSQNRMRGFRKNDTRQHILRNNTEPPSVDTEHIGDNETTDTEGTSGVPNNNVRSDRLKTPLFCHYYSNYGKCDFESKTGNKCKYLHKDNVPMCQSGTSCTRSKCMFKHPKLSARQQGFLNRQTSAQSYSVQQQANANQFHMMNPWWVANQGQNCFPNPWQTNQLMFTNPWQLNQANAYRQ